MCVSQLVYTHTVVGHLGHFLLWAIVKNAMVNIGAQISLWDSVFLLGIPVMHHSTMGMCPWKCVISGFRHRANLKEGACTHVDGPAHSCPWMCCAVTGLVARICFHQRHHPREIVVRALTMGFSFWNASTWLQLWLLKPSVSKGHPPLPESCLE